MDHREDIDHLLRDWEYTPGEILARLIRADDREVIQVRVDLGILQLEISGRPDGSKPGGADTYLDYLRALVIREGDAFTLTEDHQNEVDREFLQYYQRRICWLSLRRFKLAVEDADHNLALMDLLHKCSPGEEWLDAHEQYRPFILFHRTQAAALASLEEGGPSGAIAEIETGLAKMREVFTQHDAEEHFEENEMVQRLEQLRIALEKELHGGEPAIESDESDEESDDEASEAVDGEEVLPKAAEASLEERLADAVRREEYELAAMLRDEINRRSSGH